MSYAFSDVMVPLAPLATKLATKTAFLLKQEPTRVSAAEAPTAVAPASADVPTTGMVFTPTAPVATDVAPTPEVVLATPPLPPPPVYAPAPEMVPVEDIYAPLDEPDDNTAMYVGLGLLAAAALAGGWFFIARKKRNA
jgi:LPXTG-motif cell wall-anchored protein